MTRDPYPTTLQAAAPALDAHAAAALADDIEARAFADLYDAAPPPLKAGLGLRVERVGDATALLAPALPTTMFNRTIGLGLGLGRGPGFGVAQPARESDVDALVDLYRAAGVGAWWLHWNPYATPASLPESLPARGFTVPARRTWAKMLRAAAPTDASTEAQTSLSIAAADAPTWRAASRCVADAFGMPPMMADWLAALHGRAAWRVYAVKDGDVPVGGGCMFVDGDTAWLGMGSVLPSHRGRGAQLALMARRIGDAAAEGCRNVVTETGERVADEPNPSLANMVKAGFALAASRLNFEWRAKA